MVLLSKRRKKRIVEKKAVRKKGNKKGTKKGRKKGRKGKNDVPPKSLFRFFLISILIGRQKKERSRLILILSHSKLLFSCDCEYGWAKFN